MSGWHSDERTHEVHCHVLHTRNWSVTFHDYADREAKFPWLLLETAEEVLKLLSWGHISDEDLEQHHRDLKRWGVGGGVLHLTTKQYHQLKARRVGWPWTGYELQRMMDAGTYPPTPLSQAQEDEFMKRRKNLSTLFSYHSERHTRCSGERENNAPKPWNAAIILK